MTSNKDKPLHSNMSAGTNTGVSIPGGNANYFEFRVQGHLSDLWADWFEDLTIQYLDDGEMLLSGFIVDQAALMGVLNKLSRLNLTLISVNQVKNKKS